MKFRNFDMQTHTQAFALLACLFPTHRKIRVYLVCENHIKQAFPTLSDHFQLT